MSAFQDRQVKSYAIFLFCFLLLLALSGIWIYKVQEGTSREALFQQNKNMVSSLLEQGVSQDAIMQAVTNAQGNSSGEQFLRKIGITAETPGQLLPVVHARQQTVKNWVLCLGALLATILIAGSLLFFIKRERLYKEAHKAVSQIIEGNDAAHLPRLKEGTIYQLFSSVDQLAASLRAKGDSEKKVKVFLKNTISDISHQFKTPLAALTMYNEIIAAETENAGTVAEFSKKSEASLERMTQLTQALLKITRLDAGSIAFEMVSQPICVLIGRAVEELTERAKAEEKEIHIKGLGEEEIICDLQWTSEAIENIVKNALDHTEKGGKIEISWERSPAMLRLLIADNGTGIAPEDFHHIFKRFYRSKNSLSTQGSGLGLSLAKSIIEGQGGLISAQSSKDQGTVFSIAFLTKV